MSNFASRTSAQDRDIQLEGRYRLDCGCCRSLLAHLLTHEEELVEAYREWARVRPGRVLDSEAVAAWEQDRFGAAADPASHGRLLFTIRQAMSAAKREHPGKGWLPYKEGE